MSVSGVEPSDSVTHILVSLLFQKFFPQFIILCIIPDEFLNLHIMLSDEAVLFSGLRESVRNMHISVMLLTYR